MKHQNCNADESTERFVAETGIEDTDISDKRYCHYYKRSCRCKAANCGLRILQPAEHFFGFGYELELVFLDVEIPFPCRTSRYIQGSQRRGHAENAECGGSGPDKRTQDQHQNGFRRQRSYSFQQRLNQNEKQGDSDCFRCDDGGYSGNSCRSVVVANSIRFHKSGQGDPRL